MSSYKKKKKRKEIIECNGMIAPPAVKGLDTSSDFFCHAFATHQLRMKHKERGMYFLMLEHVRTFEPALWGSACTTGSFETWEHLN